MKWAYIHVTTIDQRSVPDMFSRQKQRSVNKELGSIQKAVDI